MKYTSFSEEDQMRGQLSHWESRCALLEKAYNPFAGIDYEIQEFAMKYHLMERLEKIFNCHDTFFIREFSLEDGREISISEPKKGDREFNTKVFVIYPGDRGSIEFTAKKANLTEVLEKAFQAI